MKCVTSDLISGDHGDVSLVMPSDSHFTQRLTESTASVPQGCLVSLLFKYMQNTTVCLFHFIVLA